MLPKRINKLSGALTPTKGEYICADKAAKRTFRISDVVICRYSQVESSKRRGRIALKNLLIELLYSAPKRSRSPAHAAVACFLVATALTPRAQPQRGFESATSGRATGSTGGYYALIIGIDKYPLPLPSLKTAVNDAQSIGTTLRQIYGFQVTLLLDQAATRDNILKAMVQLRKKLDKNDNVLIYYAGHGSFDRKTKKGYWLPVDASPDSLDTSHNISADDITTEVRGIAASHVLIVSDSCFSGDLSRSYSTFSPSDGNAAYIRRMQYAPSRTLMASGSDEPVSDSGSEGHSIFAGLFLQALRAGPGPVFTAEDLFISIRKAVLARSGQSPQYVYLHDSLLDSTSLDNGDFVFTRGPAVPGAIVDSEASGSYIQRGAFSRAGIWRGFPDPFTLEFGPAESCRWQLWITNPVLELHLDNSGHIQGGSVQYIYNERWIQEPGKSCVSDVPADSRNLLTLSSYRMVGQTIHAEFRGSGPGAQTKPGAMATFDGEINDVSSEIHGELRLTRTDLSPSAAAWIWNIRLPASLSPDREAGEISAP